MSLWRDLKLYASKLDMNMVYSLKPSQLHEIGFVILTLTLLMAVFFSQLWQWFFIALPLVAAFALLHYRRYFGVNRIQSCSVDRVGLWTLNGEGGFALQSSSSIRRYWAFLVFKKDKQTRMLAVFPDSLEKEAFRKLRVQARDRY